MPLGRLVALVGQQLGRHWQQAVTRNSTLSHTAFFALAVLGEEGALTHREVADHCWISPGTLTPVIDALERDGLLQRRRDSRDRRIVRLHITPGGTETLRTTWAAVAAEFRRIVPELGADEERLVRSYLLTVLEGLKGERSDPRG